MSVGDHFFLYLPLCNLYQIYWVDVIPYQVLHSQKSPFKKSGKGTRQKLKSFLKSLIFTTLRAFLLHFVASQCGRKKWKSSPNLQVVDEGLRFRLYYFDEGFQGPTVSLLIRFCAISNNCGFNIVFSAFITCRAPLYSRRPFARLSPGKSTTEDWGRMGI